MQWSQSQPHADLINLDAIKQHLRIDETGTDNDLAAEDDYLAAIIAAATSHAEQVMQCSLIRRTITATFYAGETLYLPRGPIIGVSSVTLNGQAVNGSAYSVESYGTTDLLRYNRGTTQPHAAPAALTVVYDAGYGDTPASVPDDILQAIKCHVGLMFEQREAATDRTVTPVPFIAEFYKLRSRGAGVG